ncbi:MAG: hypothetical protein ABIH48_00565 [Candidatus Falkowbacteria bacterium]
MSDKRNEVRVEFTEKPFFQKSISKNGSVKRGSQIVEAQICVKLIFAERRFKVRWSGKGENSQQALKDAIQGAINLIGKKDFYGIKFSLSKNGSGSQRLNGGINRVCKKLTKKEK